MRFQLGTGAVYPTPPPALALLGQFSNGGINTDLQWDSFDGPSGESGIIIQGGTLRLTQLVASWGGLEIAGRLEVSASPDKVLCVLFQTAPTGSLTVTLNSLLLHTESYGLRCSNSSVGGEYVVTAYYYLEPL